MSDQPDQAAAMRSAIDNNKNLEKIKAAYEELADTGLDTLLDQLATAIEEERYEDAELIFKEVTARYESISNDESELSEKINAARTSQNSSFDTVQELTTYLREANQIRVQRTKLISTVSTFLHNQLEDTETSGNSSSSIHAHSSSEIVDIISRSQNKENEFTSVVESAVEKSSTVSVPPTLKIPEISADSDQIKTDESVILDVTISNVGDSSVTDIIVSAEAPDSVDVINSQINMPRLSANESVSKSFTVTPVNPGPHSITVSAKGKESYTVTTKTITATSEVKIPAPYRPYVDDDGFVTKPGLNKAISDYLQDEINSRQINRIIRSYLSGNPITK